MSVSVVIAEDHALFRSGLRQLLMMAEYIEVVGEAGDGFEAVECVQRLQPDILLLDLSMPRRGGLEVLEYTRKISPNTKVLIISMHATAGHLRASLQRGAYGYLLKTADTEEFLFAIQAVRKGQRYISAELTDTLVGGYLGEDAPALAVLEDLTLREREVLKLVAEGYVNKEIAEHLDISEKTVDTHRTNFMRKLKLRNVREITLFALQQGLIRCELPGTGRSAK